VSPSPTPDPSTWIPPKLRIDHDGLWFPTTPRWPGIVANLRDLGWTKRNLQIGPARVPVEEDAPSSSSA
jgi:hypothetical protein